MKLSGAPAQVHDRYQNLGPSQDFSDGTNLVQGWPDPLAAAVPLQLVGKYRERDGLSSVYTTLRPSLKKAEHLNDSVGQEQQSHVHSLCERGSFPDAKPSFI